MRPVQKRHKEGRTAGQRYKIGSLLVRDMSGDVYTCQDLVDGNATLVIRILSESNSYANHEELSRRMALLQRLRHPGLARIFDFGVLDDSDELFLVAERVAGTDFYSATDNKDPQEILALLGRLSDALQYLHVRGLAGGNLRPANILIGSEKQALPKLLSYSLPWCDIGMDALRDCESICYTAPEILRSGSSGSDCRAVDFYALGVLLYHTMVRRLPFADGDPDFLIQKQIQGSIDLEPVKRLDISGVVLPLLECLLEKDPERRLKSAEEAIAGLSFPVGSDLLLPEDKDVGGRFSAIPFVEREKEMQLLTERAVHVRESGRGWTSFIVGEAGLGKSRCMEELRSWALIKGWRVVEGNCPACGGPAYGPYRQILDCTDFSEDSDRSFSDETTQISEFGAFDSTSGFAAGQFRDRLTRELVRRLSSRPTLLFLHDIHWADKASCAILEYLCSDIRAHPIFLCVSFRSGENSRDILERVVENVRRGECGEVIELDPLTRDGVRRMIEGLTGGGRRQEDLSDWLFRNVGGNPFFLEEMLAHLAEQRVFLPQAGRWTLATHLMINLDVPAGVGAVLQKRIARLSSPARELLEWLSLFRRAVSVNDLKKLTASRREPVELLLAELAQRQLLRVEPSVPEKMAAFNHDLVAEVVKGMIPRQQKRRMHRKVADLLEYKLKCGDETEGLLHELTRHCIEGALGERSVRYALESVARFRLKFANEDALRCFEHVFKYRNRLPKRKLCLAAIDACDSMFATGAARQAVQLLHSILRSRSGIEPELLARLYLQLALAYRHLGEWNSQERNCRKGLKVLEGVTVEHRLTETMLWTELAFGFIVNSRSRRALDCLDQAFAACPDKCPPVVGGRIHNLYAILYCVACKFKKAATAGDKALSILQYSGEYLQECSAVSIMGSIHMRRGRFPAALKQHLRAVELSEKSRAVVPHSQASGNLAECLCRMGRIPEALAAIDRAAAAAAKTGNLSICHACDVILAEIKLAAGDYRATRQILNNLECNGKPALSAFTAGHAYYVSAELNFRLGGFQEALDDIRKLLEIRTREEPIYEYELAEALRERIFFERDGNAQALERLKILEKHVVNKRWSYQSCLIKIHICEILIRLGKLCEGTTYAQNALRLAEAMHASHLSSWAQLLLGTIQSHWCEHRFSGEATRPSGRCDADRAIHALEACLGGEDHPGAQECRWRALAELSFIHRICGNSDLCFRYARQAYEALGKLEEQAPADMLSSFREAFGRGRTRLELVRLIEAGRTQVSCREYPAVENTGDANARVLLRMTAVVNSIQKLPLLLEGIINLILPATALERGWIFLWDADEEKLKPVGCASVINKSAVSKSDIPKTIMENVFREGRPMISVDARRDSRIMSGTCGKLLCAPLKTPDCTVGVFYADSDMAVESIAEAEIDLLATFCNLAALAVDNSRDHRHLAGGMPNAADVKASLDIFPEIFGKSPAVEEMKSRIGLVANSPLDVLITGESGSGKELVARAICEADRRRNGKFISVDCGALADGVAEAELFGYRKGAFTGAVDDRDGLLQAAAGGILFLDEISNMPMRLQVKLLRALQEREVRRLGETFPRKIDIRVLAATNKDLAEEIKNVRFCGDLFYRLKAVEIRVPALREHVEDIPALIALFLGRAAEQEGGNVKRLTPAAIKLLMQYSWPGNIRELKNIVTAAYYSASGNVIEVQMLPPEVRLRDVDETTTDSAADRLYRGILAGKGEFEDLVKKPYLNRRYEASVVRDVIRRALSDSAGIYRKAFMRLGIPQDRYASTMQFLKRHRCYLDYIPFRRDCDGDAER